MGSAVVGLGVGIWGNFVLNKRSKRSGSPYLSGRNREKINEIIKSIRAEKEIQKLVPKHLPPDSGLFQNSKRNVVII